MSFLVASCLCEASDLPEWENPATLRDLAITADLDDAYCDGRFHAAFELGNDDDAISIEAALYDGDSEILAFNHSRLVPASGSETLSFRGEIPNARGQSKGLWDRNAETAHTAQFGLPRSERFIAASADLKIRHWRCALFVIT